MAKRLSSADQLTVIATALLTLHLASIIRVSVQILSLAPGLLT